jgi:hypothetical protein
VADDIASLRPTLKDLQRAMEHRDRKILEWWFRGRHEMPPELYDFLADLMAGKSCRSCRNEVADERRSPSA